MSIPQILHNHGQCGECLAHAPAQDAQLWLKLVDFWERTLLATLPAVEWRWL